MAAPADDVLNDDVLDLDQHASVDKSISYREAAPDLKIVEGSDLPVVASPYDAEKARDDVRGRLALILIYLLVFVVVGAFASIWLTAIIAWSKGGYIDLATPLKDMLQILLAPVVGLVGAATGYYFGISSQKPNSK